VSPERLSPERAKRGWSFGKVSFMPAVACFRGARVDLVRCDLLPLLVETSRRYEKKSLVLTTNLAFADWHTIFPSATCATALVERVVHHADILKIEGESYRLRESHEDADTRRASRREEEEVARAIAGQPSIANRCHHATHGPFARQDRRTAAGKG
jgi:hypothetical protein